MPNSGIFGCKFIVSVQVDSYCVYHAAALFTYSGINLRRNAWLNLIKDIKKKTLEIIIIDSLLGCRRFKIHFLFSFLARNLALILSSCELCFAGWVRVGVSLGMIHVGWRYFYIHIRYDNWKKFILIRLFEYSTDRINR